MLHGVVFTVGRGSRNNVCINAFSYRSLFSNGRQKISFFKLVSDTEL